MWWYIIEYGSAGLLTAIRKINKSSMIKIENIKSGKLEYFIENDDDIITIWEYSNKGINNYILDIPYYEEEIFKNENDLKELINIIFTSI